MALRAIETAYKGYRFRSRLEARWAVAFDALGLPWQYEAQGYVCERPITRITSREDHYSGCSTPSRTCDCTFGPSGLAYLPDFWLPTLGMHVEVKGEFDVEGYGRFMDIAADLCGGCGGCRYGPGDGGSNRGMLLVGDISKPGRTPAWLHMHKGDLVAAPFDLERALRRPERYPTYDSADGLTLASDVGCHSHPLTSHDIGCKGGTTEQCPIYGNADVGLANRNEILKGFKVLTWSVAWRNACDKARAARFEHGETPR